MDDSPLVVIIAGLCSGAVLGIFISTETERKLRHGQTGWALFSKGSFVGVILNHLVGLALIAVALAFVAISILRLGNAYPLSQSDSYLLACAWFAGAGIAKWGRYRYWKRRTRWV